MTIGEVSVKLGMSQDTLRYYEKIGLIRGVARKSGKRDYSPRDVVWLQFIQRLKETSMPLKDIARYSELRYEGDGTIGERKEMLLSHRGRLQAEIGRLQGHLEALRGKIKTYEEMEREYEPVSKGPGKTG